MRKLNIVIISLLVLLIGCSNSNAQHNKELEESIDSIVQDETKSEIKIETLTTFEWDKVFLFSPYSTQSDIEKQLGTDFKNSSNIETRDDIYLLVFLNDDKVVEYAEIQRHGSDFSIGKKNFLTPSDDVIRIERNEQ